MKKLSVILLILVLSFGLFTFSACGNSDDDVVEGSQGAYLAEGDEVDEDVDLSDVDETAVSGVDALTPTDSKYFNWEIYGSGSYLAYQITGWSSVTDGRPAELIIPREYNGLPVIGIKQGAFRGDDTITGVKTGSKFLFVGKRAFTDCTKLALVELGPNVCKVAASAFRGCVSLKEITFPVRVRKVFPSVLRGCTSLTSVTLSAETTDILSCAFMDCHALTSINIPSSVANIGTCAFMNCRKITSISLSSNVTVIETDTFSGCTSLKTFVSGVKNKAPSGGTYCFTVKLGAFYGCEKLDNLTIPSDSSVSFTAFRGTPHEERFSA